MPDLIIEPSGTPISGRILVPRDKSIAHRLALLAGLAEGESLLKDYPRGQDNLTTLNFLAALGAEIRHAPEGVRIRGFGRSPREPERVVDAENSGTTVRLALGITGGFPISACFSGDSSLIRRPMGRVTEPLIEMGVRVLGRNQGKNLPLVVSGPATRGLSKELPVASAQVKSAILLCGLVSGVPVELREPLPTRNHTELLLKWLGYPLKKEGTLIRLSAKLGHPGFESAIPRDPSQAAFFAALAVVQGGKVVFPELLFNPTRLKFFHWLEAMGAEVHYEPPDLSSCLEPIAGVEVTGQIRKGISLNPEDIAAGIDELPLFALFGTVLPEGIELRGAGELRYKESDRIQSIARVARALGAVVEEYEDGLKIFPGRPPESATVYSEGDHRIAMASAVFSLALRIPLHLKGAEAVKISYPGFFEEITRRGLATLRCLTP